MSAACQSHPSPARVPTFRVTWAAGDKLWLDTGSGARSLIPADLATSTPQKPRFVSADRVAVLIDGVLYGINTITLARHEILRVDGPILTFDVSSNGRLVTYFSQPKGTEPHEVHVYDQGSRRDVKIFTVSYASDRDLSRTRDVLSVQWSPDDTFVLATDTEAFPGEKQTSVVLGQDGAVKASLIAATFPTWRPGANTVVYRDIDAGQWWEFNPATQQTARVEIRSGLMNPSISEDGRFMLLDDGRSWSPNSPGTCTCSIYMYDFTQKTERRITTGAVVPRWVGARLLIAEKAGPCPSEACSIFDPSWSSLGRWIALSPTGRTLFEREGSVVDADVWTSEGTPRR
jgi:hypothetical protein